MSDPKFDADNPEWTAEDFARAKRGDDTPEAIRKAFPRTRGPQKAPTKEQVTLRLDPDVLAKFKAGGPGWQGRINQALRRAVS